MAEQEMPEVEEEVEEELPLAEEPTETETELATGGGMQHTIEEIPELSGKTVGDTITMAIREISDDGNTYTLAVASEPETPEEALPGTGREAVEEALLGTETPELPEEGA